MKKILVKMPVHVSSSTKVHTYSARGDQPYYKQTKSHQTFSVLSVGKHVAITS